MFETVEDTKTRRLVNVDYFYSILSSLVKKSYLDDKLLNPEYQVIASWTFIYQQIHCEM